MGWWQVKFGEAGLAYELTVGQSLTYFFDKFSNIRNAYSVEGFARTGRVQSVFICVLPIGVALTLQKVVKFSPFDRKSAHQFL